MSYESWRVSYQSSEQAARAAWKECERLRKDLDEIRQAANTDCGAVENSASPCPGITTRKIYAVTSGFYSDYRVAALFSTPELAHEFMSAVPDNDYNALEEFELNPNTADLIRRCYRIWDVHMLRDGSTERVTRYAPDLYEVTNVGHRIWRRTQAPAFAGKGIPDILTSKVWAKNEKQALKNVNEHRIQMIASGEWD